MELREGQAAVKALGQPVSARAPALVPAADKAVPMKRDDQRKPLP